MFHRDEHKRHNQMFIAREFLRFRGVDPDAADLHDGTPPEPDVLWAELGEPLVGIEVADAPLDRLDAVELYTSLRDRVRTAPADAFLTASSSHDSTLLTRPRVDDPLSLASRLTEVGRDHCDRTYEGADTLCLLLNGSARPLANPSDAETVVSAVALRSFGPFAEVYVCLAVSDEYDRAFFALDRP